MPTRLRFMMAFLDPDEAHDVKAAIHGAMLTLAAMIWAYNVGCLRRRPAARHWLNGGTFSWVILLEALNLRRHTRAGDADATPR